MTTSEARFPAELRALINRLAVEQLRGRQWALSAELRRQVREQLQQGVAAEAVAADLRRQIGEAAADAGRRSLEP